MNRTVNDPTGAELPAFDSLPWLADPWRRLSDSIEQDRLAHALLITGPAGIGKLTLAHRLIHGLLCTRPGADPCGECRSCKLVKGAHPDRFVLELLEDKREIIIDQVRELIAGLVLTTSVSPYKVALVNTAEQMNRASANSLLKTLEEPPGKLVTVLVSHDPSQLLPTIRSRCQVLAVPTPDADASASWLQAQTSLSAEEALIAMEAASNSPLKALELVQDELLPHYATLRTMLAAAIGKPSRASAISATLGKLDPATIWRWLSIAAASATRSALGLQGAHWPDTDYELSAEKLARLQSKAEWAMRQLGKGLRQDLLLQEWLLEWARLPAAESIR